jgi:hypothetical protein
VHQRQGGELATKTTIESDQRVHAAEVRRDGTPTPVSDGVDALAGTRTVKALRSLVARLEQNWALSVALILGAIAAMSLL